MKKNLKIRDIAQMCNVSSATVSRVINNSENVAPETKEMVLKAIEKTGFQPNKIAKALRTKKNEIIGLIVNTIENPYTALFVSLLEEKLKLIGKNIVLMDIKNDLNSIQKSFTMLSNLNIDRYIIQIPYITPMMEELFSHIKNNIVLFNAYSQISDYRIVSVDNFAIGKMAAEYIRHKKLPYVMLFGGNIENGLTESYFRFRGFIDNFNIKKEKEFKNSNYFDIDFDYQKTYTKIQTILKDNHPKPLVFFCFSDLIAIAAVNCLYDNHLKINEDYFVLGVDGIYISSISRPYKITTIKHPFLRMAEQTVKLVLEDNPEKLVYYFEPELVLGDTL